MLNDSSLINVNPYSIRHFELLENKISEKISNYNNKFEYNKFYKLFKFYENSIATNPVTGKKCFIFRDKDHYSKCGETILAFDIQ